MKRVIFFLALSGALSAVQLVRGPYLQQGTPESVVVRWRTDEPSRSVVRFGETPGVLDQVAQASGVLTEHVVQLRGLKPATRYYYALGAETQTLVGDETCTFQTAPVVGSEGPVKIWVLGDPGTATDDQRAVRDGFARYVNGATPDLWLMLGDNAYARGTDAEYQKAVFEMYPGTLRRSVLWPTLGNHDAGSANSDTQSGVYYDLFTLPTRGQAGGVPSGTEAYYSFDHGNIHFVCLDSHDTDRSADGAMMAWLKADLAANRQRWLIAFFHHPTYTKGSHDSDSALDSGGRMKDMREVFLPVLEAADVDLVLTGHSHVYERSWLLGGHFGESSTFDVSKHVVQRGDGRETGDGAYRKTRARRAGGGEVSIVAGSSGHNTDKPAGMNHPAMCVSLNEIGSLLIEVSGDRLESTFIDGAGQRKDWFSIQKP